MLHSGRDQKMTKRWRFATLSLSLFDHYRSLFYVDGKKIIPSNIQSLLKTPIALAVWYMDDGYMRTDKSGAYLCTSSFTLLEHKQLQYVLLQNYGIETSIHFAGKYARLHIPARSRDRFLTTISPHIVSCMQYKLSLTP
ncbi:MAG: hypothetical protein WDZ94_03055 [Patescibacteria group bacterium]